MDSNMWEQETNPQAFQRNILCTLFGLNYQNNILQSLEIPKWKELKYCSLYNTDDMQT